MIKLDACRCFEPAPGLSRWGSQFWGRRSTSEQVINVEDVDNSTALVDPVDDAICPAPGAVAASELEHRFADPVRVARKPGIAKLQYSGEETTRSGGVAQNDFGVGSTLEPLGGPS
jgi:hypothetical protein